MSLLNLRRERGEPEHTEPPTPYRPPRPQPPGPHQLGSTTLAAVDELTGMTAEEIERVADSVVAAAQETADVLREAARRVRHTGMVANERLANFVRAASTCNDAARMLQDAVALRDVQPEPAAPVETEAPAKPVDLDAIAAEIGVIGAAVKEEKGSSHDSDG
jgi:hypothetical protein